MRIIVGCSPDFMLRVVRIVLDKLTCLISGGYLVWVLIQQMADSTTNTENSYTLLGAPVQLNAIQYSYTVNTKFTKFIMFSFVDITENVKNSNHTFVTEVIVKGVVVLDYIIWRSVSNFLSSLFTHRILETSLNIMQSSITPLQTVPKQR